MRLPILLLIPLLLFATVACPNFDAEQATLNDYLEEMRGGDSPNLQDQGNSLRERLNEIVEGAQSKAPSAALVAVIDALIDGIGVYVDKLGAVEALGELRSYHNIYIRSWKEQEAAAQDLRLFLLDPQSISLLNSYTDGSATSIASERDYRIKIDNYQNRIK